MLKIIVQRALSVILCILVCNYTFLGFGADICTLKSTNKPDVQSDHKKILRKRNFKEPVTSNGLRITSVWLAAIKERIPLTVTLAISFLACHIARESVLPTDITKWALEGVLPYLAAFLKVDVKSNDGQYAPVDLLLSNLDSKRMFKPMRMISARMVEFLAAHIAVRVGLELPPVNLYALSCRFLKELDLPVEKFARYVGRLYEWYSPSNLWLEAREDAFPSRVYVMSMILITIKILYRLDGGKFNGQSAKHQLETQKDEACLRPFNDNSNLDLLATKDAEIMQFRNEDQEKDKGSLRGADSQHREKIRPMSNGGILNTNSDVEEWNAKELIGKLERTLLRTNSPSFDYQKDLPTYLRYCKDIIFSGAVLSAEEELAYSHFSKLYEKTSKEDPTEFRNKTQANGVTDCIKPQCRKRVPNAELGVSSKLESPGVSLNSASSSYCDKKGLPAITSQKSEKKSKSFKLLSEKIGETETMKDNLSQSLVEHKQEENQPTNKKIQDQLIEEMEGSDFRYLPPTSGISEPDRYLFYIHKRMKGRFDRFVHGDYFIVLSACAKVVQVDPKVLHRCIRQLERQLKGIENRIHSLKQYIYTSRVLEKEMATDVG